MAQEMGKQLTQVTCVASLAMRRDRHEGFPSGNGGEDQRNLEPGTGAQVTEQEAQGRLIVFEGPDNVGKSTLAGHLTSRLCEAGIRCEQLAFPGNRPGSLGRLVYNLHHNASGLGFGKINATSLQMLHIAAHIDVIERTYTACPPRRLLDSPGPVLVVHMGLWRLSVEWPSPPWRR